MSSTALLPPHKTPAPLFDAGAASLDDKQGTPSKSAVPMVLPPLLEEFPAELTRLNRWILFRTEPKDNGRLTKPPIHVQTGRDCSPHNKANQFEFAEACTGYERFSHAQGLGFSARTEDRLLFLDLDDCRDPRTEKITEQARAVIERIPSRWEVSVSGTGLRCIAFGEALPPKGRKHEAGGVEFACGGDSYMTLTGRVLKGSYVEIRDCGAEIHALHRELFGVSEVAPTSTIVSVSSPLLSSASASLSDTELLVKIRKSKQGSDFSRLFDKGERQSFKSPSEADMRLMGILAGWTRKDAEQMMRLFDSSVLAQRDKWKDDARYRQKTLDTALENCTWLYDPNYGSRGEAAKPKDSDEAEAEGEIPDSALMQTVKQSEAAIRRYGVKIKKCSLIIPEDIDREDFEAVGVILNSFEGNIGIIQRFQWGDWYGCVPKVRGAKQRIVGEWFRGYDPMIAHQKTISRMKDLSEWKRIAECIPAEYREPRRPWSFYEAAAVLPEEERLAYLKQKPRKGIVKEMQELAQKKSSDKHDLTDTEGGHEPVAATTGNFAPSSSCVSLTGERESNFTASKTEYSSEISELTSAKHSPKVASVSYANEQTGEMIVMDSNLFGVLDELRDEYGEDLPEVLRGLLKQNAEVKDAPWLRVKIIPAMWQAAEVLAEQRKRGHDHCRTEGEDHGSDFVNLKYERYGVLAELIIVDGLEREGFKPEGYRFVARRALSEPDFCLNGVQFDVKAVEPDGKYVCINDGKHSDQKCRPDFYVAVLFESETEATISLIPSCDVDKWERRKGKVYTSKQGKQCQREDYRSVHRETVREVRAWSDFGASAPKRVYREAF